MSNSTRSSTRWPTPRAAPWCTPSPGERTVGELAAPHPISLAAASKHVKVLERAGLLRRTVLGRRHLRLYEQFWNDRLDALEEFVTRPEEESS